MNDDISKLREALHSLCIDS